MSEHRYTIMLTASGRWAAFYEFDAGTYGLNEPLGEYRWLWLAQRRVRKHIRSVRRSTP
jgi:hypothetical protein